MRKPVETDWKKVECAEPKGHDEADLCEQRRMSQAAEDAASWAAFQSKLGIAGFAAVLLSLIFTGWAAVAAGRAAKAAESAVDVTRDAAARQLSPYVHVRSATFQWDNGGIKIVVECFNSGQTPATYYEVACRSAVAGVGEPTSDIPEDLDFKAWSALGGGGTDMAALRRGCSEEHAREVMNSSGTKNFFVLGTVRYADVLDNIYVSDFVYFTSNVRPNSERTMSRSTGRVRTYEKISDGKNTSTKIPNF